MDTNPNRWRHRCEDRGCYLASRWALTELDGTLPRGIGFGDIDGMVEVGGRFLFIEHKPEGYSWNGNSGQWRALKRLDEMPGVTVWWLRDCGDGYEIAEPGRELVKVSKTELRDMVRDWADIASAGGRTGHGGFGRDAAAPV